MNIKLITEKLKSPEYDFLKQIHIWEIISSFLDWADLMHMERM